MLLVATSDTFFLVSASSLNISFCVSFRGATAAVTSARIVVASSVRIVSAIPMRTDALTSLRMLAAISVLKLSVRDFLKSSRWVTSSSCVTGFLSSDILGNIDGGDCWVHTKCVAALGSEAVTGGKEKVTVDTGLEPAMMQYAGRKVV